MHVWPDDRRPPPSAEWGHDSPALVARKAARSVASSRPVLETVERIANALIRSRAPGRIARPLCGCVISGYMWQGIHDGID